MPNNDTPISSFQDATEINSADKLTGLQNNVNRNFSFSTILSWFVQTVAAAFVPVGRKVNNKALSADITLDASDVGAQGTITASGILKGDGAGGVSAAVAGTDYGTYSKPSGGIPSSDMTSAVQTSLGKADSAYQKPSGGIPASDLANGVIPSVPSPSDSTPQALGTAAAGSSGNYSRADHVHQKPTYSKSDVGLGNVANELQYSANNPPPYPVTSVNGNTGAVTVSVPSAYASNPEMDGTASPGSSGSWAKGDHVHPSDTSKANETELAYVESGTTASRAYAIGEYFCMGGSLYRAKTAISSGASFTVGTNCEAVTGGGFNDLRSDISSIQAKSQYVYSGSNTSVSISVPDWNNSVFSFMAFGRWSGHYYATYSIVIDTDGYCGLLAIANTVSTVGISSASFNTTTKILTLNLTNAYCGITINRI